MSETRKIAAILVADIVGYSRLAGADEDRTLARLRALRSDLIDPTIARVHGVGRIDRGWGLVFPGRQPGRAGHDNGARARRLERRAGRARASFHRRAAFHKSLRRSEPGLFRRRRHREPHHRSVAHPRQFRDRAQYGLHIQGKEHRRQGDRQGTRRTLRARRVSAARSEPGARQRATHRRRNRRASLGRPLRGRRGRPVQAARSGGRAIGQCVELRTRPGGSGNGSPLQKPRRYRFRHARLRGALAVLAATDEGQQHCHSSLVRTGAQDRPERPRCVGRRRRYLFE